MKRICPLEGCGTELTKIAGRRRGTHSWWCWRCKRSWEGRESRAMSILVTRITKVNGEVKNESTVVAEYTSVERIEIPILTMHPPLLEDAKITLELRFDPPLLAQDANAA